MNVYLIRHGRAVDAEAFAPDHDRALSARGRREILAIGRELERKEVRFDCIVVSPFVRAVETAELLAVTTGFDQGLTVDAEFTPDGSPRRMRDRIRELYAEHQSLALVGHEPSMGGLLSLLLDQAGLALEKGACVRVKLKDDGTATLKWRLAP